MAFGLSIQAEDSMIANNFVTAQLDAEEDPEQPFANEQERLAMPRVLHDHKTAYDTNCSIDLERLFNQLGSIFKPEVESPEEDSLQAAMMAQAFSQSLYIRIREIIWDPRKSKKQGKAPMSPLEWRNSCKLCTI
jgi:hypothetical protein